MAKKTAGNASKKAIKSDKKVSEKSIETKSIGNPSNLKPLVFAALFAALTAAVAPFKIPLGFTPVPITLQTLVVLMSGAMLGPYYGALAMILYVVVGALGLPVFAGGGSGIGAILGPTGGYLMSYPIAAFAIGWIIHKKRTSSIVKYGSLFILAILLLIVFSDLILNLGIMKIWSKEANSYVALVSLLTNMQRYIFALIGLAAIALLVGIAVYLINKKSVSLDTMLAMVVGTLVIYLFGAVWGKIVSQNLSWTIVFVGWVLPFIIGDTIKLLIAAYIAKTVNIRRYLK